MSKAYSALWGIALAAASLQGLPARATEAPALRTAWPTSELFERIRTYASTRGYVNLTRIAVVNRNAVVAGAITREEADSGGGTVISGRRDIPVLLLKFADTGNDPYPPANLQRELFGSWPTGTMTDFYRELSYRRFTVGGTVSPWFRLSQPADYYQGPVTNNTPCNGLCDTNRSRLGALLTETLDEANKTIDFSQYDNDGADGVPNSGDDDGFVDFVAFVHPGRGGECGSQNQSVNNNIWSHRYRLSDLIGRDYETKDLTKDGRRIRIDDYVIMPALACDGRTMIQIGVFAHEFGHAFGLPDLYDTASPARSQGVGDWDLMGSGSWGGDDRSPHHPAHMAAWSKAFLGWVNPLVVTADTRAVQLKPVETSPDVLRVNISENVYYLIEYRRKTLFDDSLTGPGVLVWRVDDAVARAGLANNRVNANPDNPGVYLVQGDGRRDLDDIARQNRGDAGDPFPGSAQTFNLDNATNPATTGNIALCNIRMEPERATFDLRVSSGSCSQPESRVRR
jgi:M6 family metalloprotease-like protein